MSYDPRAHGAACDACPLRDQDVVPPEVTAAARLVVIAEAPGRIEEKVGRHLVGPAGALTWDTLSAAGVTRAECHVTAACLCRPSGDKELEAAAACCRSRLLAEVAAAAPETPILTMGKTSTWSVLNTKRLGVSRGFVWRHPGADAAKLATAARRVTKPSKKAALDAVGMVRSADALKVLELRAEMAGRAVFPTVAPSFVVSADPWLPVFQADVRRAVRWARGDVQWETLDNAGIYEVVTDVGRLHGLGPTVAVDIETTGIQISTTDILCAGVSDGEATYVLQPWHDWMSPAFSEFMRTREACVFWNGLAFDVPVMRNHGVRFEGVNVEDGLLVSHAVASHFPKSLAFAAGLYADSTCWKILSKGGIDGKE